MSQRQYLELMGIDVWQKRLPRQAPAAQPAQQTAAPNQPQQKLDAAGSIAEVRRSLAGGAAQGSAKNTQKVVATPPPAPSKSAEDPVQAVDAPEFLLTFNHFVGLTTINFYPLDFAGIPGNHQRFLATLYQAITGLKGGSNTTEFRWPMVKSSNISQTRGEAQQVLHRHLDQCQLEVLIFGVEAAELLGATNESIYSEATVRGRQVQLLKETEVYFRDPIERRDLWRHLLNLRGRLRTQV